MGVQQSKNKKHIESYIQIIDNQKLKIDLIGKEYKELLQSSAEQIKKINQLQSYITSLQKKYKKTIEDLIEKNKTLQNQIEIFNSKNEQLEEQNEQLEEQNEQLEEQNEQLEEQNDQLEEQNDQLEEQNDQLETQNKQLEEQNDYISDHFICFIV